MERYCHKCCETKSESEFKRKRTCISCNDFVQKKCKRCNEIKPRACFYRTNITYCKECSNPKLTRELKIKPEVLDEIRHMVEVGYRNQAICLKHNISMNEFKYIRRVNKMKSTVIEEYKKLYPNDKKIKTSNDTLPSELA
jgi:hypothetical protein